ncbi:MAG: urate hydroxylase PuuD [Candidatus Acidiferrales bacterium]
MSFSLLAMAAHALEPHFSFPQGPVTELIMLRWLHFIFGIIWIGLLYFFNLVAFPTMKQLEAPIRAKVYPVMMARAMNWFRWSALITVVVGLRYYFTILSADAQNSGNPSLALRWFGWWLLVWLVAYALIYQFQLRSKGILNNPWLRTIAISVIVIAASWLILDLNGGSEVSNAHLCISVGGGIGFLMLMNTWGVVWRVQKKLIAWTRASAEQGTPMPPEAERLARWGFLASRVGFWLSFPMLFFMGAAEHYPFLSSIGR